jgi:hypothetical protein
MKIKIDSKTYKGTVTIFDRLYFAQVDTIENALANTREAFEKSSDAKVLYTVLDKHKIPALIACVEKWEINDFPETVTPETFPLTPRRETHEIINQIFDAIQTVYNGEIEIPNE